MTPDEGLFRAGLVEQWLNKAGDDLGLCLKLIHDDAPFFSAIAFHAQQAAEKYLKAFLVRHQIEFPKTHDMKELLILAARKNSALAVRLEEAKTLTPFAANVRYPMDEEELTLAVVRRAVQIAVEVRDAVEAELGR